MTRRVTGRTVSGQLRKLQRLLQIGDGLRQPSFGQIGLETLGGLVLGDRLGQATDARESVPEAQVGLRELGLKAQRLLELSDCLGKAAQAGEGVSEAQMGSSA